MTNVDNILLAITDQQNAIKMAEQRIASRIRELVDAGLEAVVYPIEEGRSHVLVWWDHSDREDVATAALSIQLPHLIATYILDSDETGRVSEG